MSLFELIPANEKNMMENYIDAYAIPTDFVRRASLETIMCRWDDNKSYYLYKMLGNNFIIEKPFAIREPFRAIKERMFDVVSKHDKFITDFSRALCNSSIVKSNVSLWVLEQLTRVETLAKNRIENEFTIEATNPNGEIKKFSAQKNSKVVPLIGKIAKWIGIDWDYEEFRIDHSMALNTAKLEGTLCLSIHPLDYMTMSDNESKWDSCMKWRECGCYRAGTVEMMNSDMVVVGYFKSDNKTMTMPDGEKWNSKKWRELFIVNPELIMDIKAYPYESDELTLACLTWIRELVEKNLGWNDFQTEYDKWIPDYDDWTFGGYDYVTFDTGYMYNDINESYTRHFYYVTNSNHEGTNLYCNYSGDYVCMCCGEVGYLDEGDEGSLICEDCTPIKYYCCNCGEWEYDLDNLHRIGGSYYCDSCYDDLRDNPFFEEGDDDECIKLVDPISLNIVDRKNKKYYKFFVDFDNFYHNFNEYLKDFTSTIHHFRTYIPNKFGYSEGFIIYYEDLTERGCELVEKYGEECNIELWGLFSQELITTLTSNLTYRIIKADNIFDNPNEATSYARRYECHPTSTTKHLDVVIKTNL